MFALFLIGAFGLICGIYFIFGTVMWKILAGENYIEFGAKYAVLRHEIFNADIIWGIIMIIICLFTIILGLTEFKKCRHCKRIISKNHNYCRFCGEKIDIN